MNPPPEHPQAPLSPSVEDFVESACLDLIDRLRRGQGARVEDYLKEYPQIADSSRCLLDLIDAEICTREEQGQTPQRAEYLDRFPQLAVEIERLFEFHQLDAGLTRTGSMVVECPYCRHKMKVKSAKTGRYKPKCGKCQRRFLLRVGNDPQAKQLVSAPLSASSGKVDSPGPAAPQIHQAAQGSLLTEDRLGGYRLLKELGRGAMGTVYLARQISLERDVALKVIQTRWSDDPVALVRFTREAYAAAQLTHHNVVQVYDLGEDRGMNFFSMEFIQGPSLSQWIRDHGKTDPQLAAGYILQAARGLQFAHSQGMIHRDVKPSNLLINEYGVVKVADLGLVKTPELLEGEEDRAATLAPSHDGLSKAGSSVTLANSAVGTPAYMAPEQADDAAGVDHRADIYSLGCTFYALLTARPPFEGDTALEVITKHKTEPVAPPETIVQHLPRQLSQIVIKMTAKKPQDRYANLGDVIEALESFLRAKNVSASTPQEEDVQTLVECIQQFNAAPTAGLKRGLPWGFVAGVSALAVISLLFSWTLAGGVIGLLILTPAFYFLISGWRERTYLFDKWRQFVLGSRWSDWLAWLGGGLLLLAVLVLTGAWWVWLGAAIVAAGLAATFHFVFDQRLADERRAPLERAETMLRRFRLRGLEESALRRFVAKYSGDDWEEFYEHLFGYEVKMAARRDLQGETKRRAKKFRPWRDPIIEAIDNRLEKLRQQRELRYLQKVEQAGLQAAGIGPRLAREQAARIAAALVNEAEQARQSTPYSLAPLPRPADPKAAAAAKRARIQAMLAEARRGNYSRRSATRTLAGWLNLLAGARLRFVLGCLLLAGCALWARQNEMFQAAGVAIQSGDASAMAEGAKGTEPLNIPLIGGLFNRFNAGMAGLVLLWTALFRGGKLSLFALPAAAVIWLGDKAGIPEMLEVHEGIHVTSLGVGVAIAVVGILVERMKED